MTSDIPNSPNRDRATLLTLLVCGAMVLIGAIAAVGLSRQIETTTGQTPSATETGR